MSTPSKSQKFEVKVCPDCGFPADTNGRCFCLVDQPRYKPAVVETVYEVHVKNADPKPADYYGSKDDPYEVMKVIKKWGFFTNALRFNSIKYLARAGKKDPKKLVLDLKKAIDYINEEIAWIEEREGKPSVS